MAKRYFATRHWIRREFIYKMVYFISLGESRSNLLKYVDRLIGRTFLVEKTTKKLEGFHRK